MDSGQEHASRSVLVSKPVLSVVTVLALAILSEVTPALRRFRLFGDRGPSHAVETPPVAADAPPEQRVGELELDQQTRDRPDMAPAPGSHNPAASGPLAQAPREAEPLDLGALEKAPVSLVDAQHLAPFYASLQRTLAKQPGAITRILYHGDSLVASDYVTSTLRRKLQTTFGDAGHGFVLMANAWASYFHMDVHRETTKGFLISRVVGPYASDGFYGLGGVSFKSNTRVRAKFGTPNKGDFGRKVSRFELAYLAEPNGGSLELSVDGQVHSEIQTASEQPESRFISIDVPDGEHTFEVYTKTGTTRTFGVVLERTTPGVVLDAIGIQGARIRFLDKQDDQHWATQLAWRKPNLLVFHFGANESGDGFAYSMADYNATMKAVLEQAKRAVPQASCLVVAAMDRARQVDDGMITVPVIPLIVEEQRKVAHEVGCAFWNTFEAMGGRGSMARWVRRELGQSDLTHPTGAGAERLGNWLYAALLEGFDQYRRAPLP
jgi:lysophospholipase L1-like esterase